MAIVAQDTFTRADVASGWGTATDGKTWANGTSSGGSPLSVSANEGVCSGNGSARNLMTLGTLSNTDGEVLYRFSTNPVTGQGDVYALCRYQDTSNYYWLGAQWVSSGSFTLSVRKRVGGANTTITSTAVTVAAGTFYWVRARVQGSNLYAKFWADGSSEPSTWTLTTTDTALTTGTGWGVAPYTATNETVQVDSFTVDDLISGGTQITTSSNSSATGAAAQGLVQLASDLSAVALFMGSNGPILATAQSPYTTWSTQSIGVATSRNGQAFSIVASDALEVLVQSPANGAYWFHYTRSGNAWSSGSNGTIIAYNSNAGNATADWAGKDAQGRWWIVGIDDILATYQVYAAWRTTGGFTASANTPINLGEQNRTGMAATLVGNYLVIVYDAGAGGLSYTRADVSGASVGAWSAPASITGVTDVTTSSQMSMCAIPGGSTAAFVYNGSGGVKALTYDATNDTWSAATTLSSVTTDRHPSVTPAGTGVVYALWAADQTGNAYSMVYKKLSGGSWDTSPTTMVASTAGLASPHAAWDATNSKLALLWTQGTTAPYSVRFDLYTPSGGGTTQNASAALSGGASSTLSASLMAAGGAAASGAGLSVVTAQALLNAGAAFAGVGGAALGPLVTYNAAAAFSGHGDATLNVNNPVFASAAASGGGAATLGAVARLLGAAAFAGSGLAALDAQALRNALASASGAGDATLAAAAVYSVLLTASGSGRANLNPNAFSPSGLPPTALAALLAALSATVGFTASPTAAVALETAPDSTAALK